MKRKFLKMICCIGITLGVISFSQEGFSTPTAISASEPDQFGYQIFEQSYSWIEAPEGVESLPFSNPDDHFYKVDLPFEFPFYENRYRELFVSTNGLILFEKGDSTFNNKPIPRLPSPNNFIAVFWDDLVVGESYNDGKALAFLSAEDGPFVIEWKGVSRAGDANHRLTFEALLYKNGKICLQYQQLAGELGKSTVGIEDMDGIIGLEFAYANANSLQALVEKKALCFERPPSGGRAKLLPPYQSRFVTNHQFDFQVQLKNTGDQGEDLYNFSYTSNPSWIVRFLVDEKTPLSDDDKDGNPDLAVAQGQTRSILARLIAPTDAQPGDYAQINLKATSSRTPEKSATATLLAAVPKRFVQFFADDRNGLNIHWISERAILQKQVVSNFTGSHMAMGDGKAGVYPLVWEVNGDGYAYLVYQLLRHKDVLFSSPSPIENHQENSYIYDRQPTVGQLVDGTTGIAWVRIAIQGSTPVYELYFLRLNKEGERIGDPIRITSTSESNLAAPRIAVTDQPAWNLVWENITYQPLHSKIEWTAVEPAGTHKEPVILLESDSKRYFRPALVELDENRVLLFYTEQSGELNLLKGGILDCQTGNFTDPFEVGQGWLADAVRMGNGDVVVAWTNFASEQTNVRLLKGPTFRPTESDLSIELVGLYEPRATENASMIPIDSNSVVITWKDKDEEDYLYYALLEITPQSKLKVQTPPMILYTAENFMKVMVSQVGQSNAPYPPERLFLPIVIQR